MENLLFFIIFLFLFVFALVASTVIAYILFPSMREEILEDITSDK